MNKISAFFLEILLFAAYLEKSVKYFIAGGQMCAAFKLSASIVLVVNCQRHKKNLEKNDLISISISKILFKFSNTI